MLFFEAVKYRIKKCEKRTRRSVIGMKIRARDRIDWSPTRVINVAISSLDWCRHQVFKALFVKRFWSVDQTLMSFKKEPPRKHDAHPTHTLNISLCVQKRRELIKERFSATRRIYQNWMAHIRQSSYVDRECKQRDNARIFIYST